MSKSYTHTHTHIRPANPARTNSTHRFAFLPVPARGTQRIHCTHCAQLCRPMLTMFVCAYSCMCVFLGPVHEKTDINSCEYCNLSCVCAVRQHITTRDYEQGSPSDKSYMFEHVLKRIGGVLCGTYYTYSANSDIHLLV